MSDAAIGRWSLRVILRTTRTERLLLPLQARRISLKWIVVLEKKLRLLAALRVRREKVRWRRPREGRCIHRFHKVLFALDLEGEGVLDSIALCRRLSRIRSVTHNVLRLFR